MRWRRTKRGIHLSYCSTHPEFRPKSAITEALRSPSVSSRLQGTAPDRLKPGLHTPQQAHACAHSFPYEMFGLRALQEADQLIELVDNPCVHVSLSYQPSTTLAVCFRWPQFYAPAPSTSRETARARPASTTKLRHSRRSGTWSAIIMLESHNPVNRTAGRRLPGSPRWAAWMREKCATTKAVLQPDRATDLQFRLPQDRRADPEKPSSHLLVWRSSQR